jgi:hypothetical protein
VDDRRAVARYLGSSGPAILPELDDQPYTRIIGTAKLHDGCLYVPIASQEENAGAVPLYNSCKFRGNVVAVDARDRREIWRSYTVAEPKPTKISQIGVQFYRPSGATIRSSPTIDLKRNLLYMMTGNGYSAPEIRSADALIAMDLKTGAIRWSKQAMSDMFKRGLRTARQCRQLPGQSGGRRGFRLGRNPGSSGKRPAGKAAATCWWPVRRQARSTDLI